MNEFHLGLVIGFVAAFAVIGLGIAIVGWADMVANKRAEGRGP